MGLKARYSLARDLMRDYPLTDSRSSHGSEQELREAFDLYQQIIDAVREGQQDPELLAGKSWPAGTYQTLAKRPHCRGSSLCPAGGAGFPSGSLSLRYTVDVLNHPENEQFLQPGLDDPVIQQLLIASFYSFVQFVVRAGTAAL